ncbi:MAG: metallophosphoesterase [Planctomycetaceae bacterium]
MQQLIGWLLLIASIAGHAEWWVMVVNRSHALRIQATRLRKFRTLHDLAVLLYPFVLLWLTGTGPSSLVRGGSFSEQSSFVQRLLVFTIAGCIPLLLGVMRWQWIRRPQFDRKNNSVRHDVLRIAASEEERAEVRGPRRHRSQRWPWNEIYHLEVNTKAISLNQSLREGRTKRTPLRLVHISDLHFIGCPGPRYYRFLVSQIKELRPDIVLFTGDLIDKMYLIPEAIDILSPLLSLAPCYFILGNHDWRYDHEQIRSQFSASGWRCVTGRSEILRVGEYQVLLAGSEQPWIGPDPPVVRDAGCDIRILLSHSPDQYPLAKRFGYDLMLSGHTHGGQVVLPVFGPVYAPSFFGVSYASGLFQLGQLTMHVSRGIGAKDPMRWRCSPELTCLEVTCEK